MKQPTSDAAKALGLHPANFLLHLASLGAEFSDCWPEVDESWIEALRRHDWARFGRPAVLIEPASSSNNPRPEVSESATKILVKLCHKRHWAGNVVAFETLKNHLCQTISNFEDALEELLERGYVKAEGRRGPYSLNQSLSKDIERIAAGGTRPV